MFESAFKLEYVEELMKYEIAGVEHFGCVLTSKLCEFRPKLKKTAIFGTPKKCLYFSGRNCKNFFQKCETNICQ